MAEEIKKEETQTEEQPKKQGFFNESRVEIFVAFFLGVTALLTAWATWIGSLHGGNQATNYAKSNNLAAEGNSEYNMALQSYQADLAAWNRIMDYQFEAELAEQKGNAEEVKFIEKKFDEFLKNNVSENLAKGIGWAIEQDEKKDAAVPKDKEVKKPAENEDDLDDEDDAEAGAQADAKGAQGKTGDEDDSPLGFSHSPFEMPGLVDSYFEKAESLLEESQKVLEDGQKDNSNGDAFNLVNVIYSVVLFLLGIVGVFKKIPNRAVVLIIAVVALLLSTIYLFTLPMPTGFSFSSFFSSNP